MNKREFLKTSGILGMGSLLPIAKTIAADKTLNDPTACTLIPTETAGPFPLDLTANTTFFRQDIRESKAGVRLNLKLKVNGAANCSPMQNVRVNVWMCDKDGLYSGYNETNNPGQLGLTYLRGYQMTDANGEVNFITIFPGWYTGRICHIHFQVYVSTTNAAISQLTFDITTKNAIYAANPTIYTKGADPTTLASDNIFSDGYAYQIATLTPNSTTGGYDAYLEVTVQGTGVTTGLGNIEKENAKQFLLGQNYPNPYSGVTNIPLYLAKTAKVQLKLFDLQGRLIQVIDKGQLSQGDHIISLNMTALGLATANYPYQAEITNNSGSFKDSKLMTAR